MADIIQLRRDTAANWTSADPTLALGEIGYETDTNKLKVGDGSTAWSGLSYWGGTDENAIHDNIDSEISAIAEKATPVSADLVIIEDSADSNNKKKVQIGNLLGTAHTHDGETLELDAIDSDGGAFNFDSADEINLRPNGDTSQYFQFQSSDIYLYLNLISTQDLTIKNGGYGSDIGLSLYRDSGDYVIFRCNEGTGYSEIFSSRMFFIKANSDSTYYTKFYVSGSKPYITFIGAEGKITNVEDPTSDQDVATKKFVDDHNWVEADITDLGSYLENLLEDTTPQLGGELDDNEKGILVTSNLSANNAYSGIVVDWTISGLTTGQCVYLSGNHTCSLADADAVGTMPCVGLFIGTNRVLTHGSLRYDSWGWTAGDRLYVGTDGNLTATAPSGSGDYIQEVAIATSATTVFFYGTLTEVKHT